MSAHARVASALWLCGAFAALAVLAGCSVFPTGTVTGTVVQAASPGNPLAGVRVTVDDSTYCCDSLADGSFSVRAPEGPATLRFEKVGYSFAETTVQVTNGLSVTPPEAIVGYAPICSGEYRFVLTWGGSPADLDAHLLMPLDPVGTDDVWSGNTVGDGGSADMERADDTGYGPEAIRITSTNPGTYPSPSTTCPGSPDLASPRAYRARVHEHRPPAHGGHLGGDRQRLRSVVEGLHFRRGHGDFHGPQPDVRRRTLSRERPQNPAGALLANPRLIPSTAACAPEGSSALASASARVGHPAGVVVPQDETVAESKYAGFSTDMMPAR